MADEKPHVRGYLHHVSPIKNSKNKRYFDMQIQKSENEVVRGVCFFPPRHKEFEIHSQNKSPVKITEFRVDAKSNDICMGANVQLQQLVNIEFARVETPETLNLSLLNHVSNGELIKIKAKVVQLQGEKKLKVRDEVLRKADAQLIDPYG